MSDERAEIARLWKEASEALCRGDWKGYAELWAPREDIEVIHPDRPDWLIGWAAIEAAYRALVTSGFRCESETRFLRLHLGSGDMAWGTAEVVIRTGDPPLERTLWQTLVFERIDSRWRLVHGHVSIPRAPDSAFA
jgi:ketosteroid isomerase-like protein